MAYPLTAGDTLREQAMLGGAELEVTSCDSKSFEIHLPNRFLTLAAPTPTNISSNSAPEQKKNGTPASPATAFASNVLPVPGAPTNNIPETNYEVIE